MDTGERLKAAVGPAEDRRAFHIDFGGVRKGAATSKIAGQDVRGYRHVISDQAIRHVRSRHPNVSAEDFANLPSLVRSATPTLSKDRGVNGVPRLEFNGTVGGVRYGYIAEVRRRSRRLEAITFYRV